VVARNPEPRSEEDVLKLRFEYFKHMTTVSTAATAATAAVYGLGKTALRDAASFFPNQEWVILVIPGVSIIGFFLSLLLSLWGLYLVADARYTELAISRTLLGSAATFILGVYLSVATAWVVISDYITLATLAGLSVPLFAFILTALKRWPRATTEESVED